jgi:exosortase
VRTQPARLSVKTLKFVSKPHAIFAALVVGSLALMGGTVADLVRYAISNESYSHIIIVPFLSLFVAFTERKKIFGELAPSRVAGGGVILAALIVSWFTNQFGWGPRGPESLSAEAAALVAFWVGAFLVCYGTKAARRAFFPLALLLFAVPVPEPLLSRVIALLQRGSAEVAYLSIRAAGAPVLRQGLYITVPGIVIQVAEECSGIRSSMGLLITCLLAAHFFLRTTWRKSVFVLLSVPLAIVKNGVRIATLTLLSLHVNPGFLRGNLHRDGGFVFYLLMLAILWPVLSLLQRSENRQRSLPLASPQEPKSQLAAG